MEVTVKICPLCHFENDVINTECESCGANISTEKMVVLNDMSVEIDEIEEEATREEPEKQGKESSVRATSVMPKYALLDRKNSHQINIPFIGGILGREGDIDSNYFNESDYVSRKHAKINFVGESYFIIDLNSHNGTYLNGDKLIPNKEYSLNDGDLLILANLELHYQFTE